RRLIRRLFEAGNAREIADIEQVHRELEGAEHDHDHARSDQQRADPGGQGRGRLGTVLGTNLDVVLGLGSFLRCFLGLRLGGSTAGLVIGGLRGGGSLGGAAGIGAERTARRSPSIIASRSTTWPRVE
ncbi:MAG TPA: hypothetical protein VLJ68_01500, partial [Chitinophagaceae bacterium]|nr:hypothetical protein [Chitinophagaceae bacterium]